METEKLGKYRLLSLIATGGMGEVFLARHEGPAGFSKTVVIKRILRHLADDQGFIDMFLNEARLAAQLQHPNIAQIFGLENESDTWFIAMEHVHGRSCRACLSEARPRNLRFPPRIAARICAQALQGLHFAHRLTDESGRSLGILHRDVSPDNVLVSFSGAVKLVDFGIAKAMTGGTFTGRLKGKFTYMAPEQFKSSAVVDARIDVFAMGVLLHELLTLQMPANAPKTSVEAGLPRARYVSRPDLPQSLNAIIEKALESDLSKRWESAESFAHALEEFIATSGEPLTAAHVAGFLEELFGREVVITNPSVAPMESNPRAHGTDVLPIQPGRPVDLVSVDSTVLVQALPPPPSTPRSAHRGLPFWVGGALLLGVGLWFTLSPGPVEVSVKPTSRVEKLPPIFDENSDPSSSLDDDSPGDPPRKKWRPPPKPGRVTVRVNPWAEVFYNNKSYGTTPLKQPIDVQPGNATFTLKNAQLGVTKKVAVKVTSGADVMLKADLFKK